MSPPSPDTYLDEFIAASGVLVVGLLGIWRMAVHYTGQARAAREEADRKNEAAHAELRKDIHSNGNSVSRVEGKIDTVIDLLKKMSLT